MTLARRGLAVRLAGFILCAVAPAQAQQVDSLAAPDDTAAARAPNSGGAFLRSVLVPGWGQATFHAYTRGGVFFATQTASWFVLLKTMAKLGEARNMEQRRGEAVRDSLLALAATDSALARRFADPDSLAAAVGRDPELDDLRSLIEARKAQREDWIAWTVFWTLASGVDALVNAQLSDFPVELRTTPRPGVGISGSVSGSAVPTPAGVEPPMCPASRVSSRSGYPNRAGGRPSQRCSSGTPSASMVM